jgi:transposase
MDEAQLEALLFPHAPPAVECRAAPDFAHLHQELKRKGVTLTLLWEEYASSHAGQAYRYSQFCLLYHPFAASLKRSMRRVHRAGEKLFIDYSGQTVPIIDAAKRVASHLRSAKRGAHTTLAEHMPESHRKHMQWTPGRLLNWALSIGTATRDVVKWQLENRPHPEQGYRACLGLLNFAKRYGEARLDAACQRALTIDSPTRKSIKSILEAKLDQHPDLFPALDNTLSTRLPQHSNVRGADYFRSTSPGDLDPCSSKPPSIH